MIREQDSGKVAKIPSAFPSLEPDTLLTRDQLAVALTAAGFPISSATLATRVSRLGGPPQAIWNARALYRWDTALAWAKECLNRQRRKSDQSAMARCVDRGIGR
jgi:hypothetical protein